MDKPTTIITGPGYYATRGGRLVFIERVEQAGPDTTKRAIGYSISGTSRETIKIWSVWFMDGKVTPEEDIKWDIVNSI